MEIKRGVIAKLIRTGAINSGALVQLQVSGDKVVGARVVEASAAAHVGPRYPYSAEAPRISGPMPCSEYKARRIWQAWVEDVIANEQS